ncbi:MAG: oligosaccharide flippase family protein [Pseudonocardia sp.]|nr:oligosaccharide flippase family protein [Pseudonocardia sp.]
MSMRTERGAAGGSVVLLAGIVITAALNYGMGVALAWMLPPGEFGSVGMLINLLLLATSVLAAGFPWALARAVAKAAGAVPEAGDTDPENAAALKARADSTFRAALVGNVGLGLLLAGVFAVVQLGTGAILPGVGVVSTLLAAGAIVLLALGSVLLGALQGSRRFDAIGSSRVLEIGVKVVLALGLVGLVGIGVLGVAVALFVSAAVAAGWAWWSLRDRWPGRGPIAGVRAFAAAVPMAVGTTCFGLMGTLDVLLLGSIGHGAGVTVAVVGVYQAAAILARAPFFVGSALSDAVFPFIAGAPTTADAHRALMVALRWVPLVLVPLQLVLLVTPGSVLDAVLPGGYDSAAGLARVITVGTAGLIVADMLLKALFARGFANAVAARVPIAVGLQLVALFVLVPLFGATGAGWSFAVGTWAATLLLGVFYLARVRPSRVRGATLVRWLVAVGILAAILGGAAVAPRPLDLLLVLVGLAVYAVLAVRTSLIPQRDVAVVRRALAKVTRRG